MAHVWLELCFSIEKQPETGILLSDPPYRQRLMNPDQTKAEQNVITCAANMQKFMHEYALISPGEFDKIGHMAMKHLVLHLSRHMK